MPYLDQKDPSDAEENDEEEDDCPNFNIYSTESINLAKNTDVDVPSSNQQVVSANQEDASSNQHDLSPSFHQEDACSNEDPSSNQEDHFSNREDSFKTQDDPFSSNQEDLSNQEALTSSQEVLPANQEDLSSSIQEEGQEELSQMNEVKTHCSGGLYSDPEDDVMIKPPPNFGPSDMTEDISEEERSYTPCLDEKVPSPCKEGLDGLDTEMISDDDKNDFEESHEPENKTTSDADALEINAKESELDFTRPDECEEGEIVDKLKALVQNEPGGSTTPPQPVQLPVELENKDDENKENQKAEDHSFKKLSKSNKDRNYRDKDSRRSKSKRRSKSPVAARKDRRREKHKEIKRYDVRTLISSKPKRDEFGRDPAARRGSRSTSRSLTPSPHNQSESSESVTPPPAKHRSRSASSNKSPPRKRSVSKTRPARKEETRSRYDSR